MRHIEGTSLFKADDDKMFIRKSDGFIMGDKLDVGLTFSIDNYEEREVTLEEWTAFRESIGMDDLTAEASLAAAEEVD